VHRRFPSTLVLDGSRKDVMGGAGLFCGADAHGTPGWVENGYSARGPGPSLLAPPNMPMYQALLRPVRRQEAGKLSKAGKEGAQKQPTHVIGGVFS
jgi:hypothetical protein